MKKIIICIMALLLFLATGCGVSKSKDSAGGEGTLTYWVEFGNQAATGVSTFDELPSYIELQKKIGVDLQFIHPVSGQVAEQFNLMVASNEYPDIISYQISQKYPGGAQKAIDDKFIIPLNDSFGKYAPNVLKYLNENPEIAEQVTTDSGQYFCFPCIYGDDYLLSYSGPIMRKDFLDKVGMDIPETVDEWRAVLTAFKDRLGIQSPSTFTIGSSMSVFTQAYGIGSALYVEDGKVKYGPVEPNFKKAINTFREWYATGLIDKNLPSVDTKSISQSILNGYTGATYGNTGSGIGNWTNSMQNNPEFKLTAVKYPVLNKGDVPFMGHRINEYSPYGSVSISTQCKNLELAAKVLDYGYSEEGQLLFNFGIEGESYKMVDGYPTYTDLVMKNPNGKSFSDMRGFYAMPNGVAATIIDKRYMEQSASLVAQKKSIELWSYSDAKIHNLPPISLNADENVEVAALTTDITTYKEQMVLKFITGVEDMSRFDAFVQQLNKMGVPHYIEVHQKAYNRYMSK